MHVKKHTSSNACQKTDVFFAKECLTSKELHHENKVLSQTGYVDSGLLPLLRYKPTQYSSII